jgi:hypothetical protein
MADTKQDGLLIRIPENLLPPGFDPQAESFALSFSGSDLLLLKRKKRHEKPEERQTVRLWSDLGSFAVPDILLLLFMNHQTGILTFELPDASKTLYFLNGSLVFAQSSLPEDRLGESLVRMGKITEEQLAQASLHLTAERKLGKILVDAEVISPKELFNGVRRQTLDIIYSLFGYGAGRCHFFETESLGDNVVNLDLDTHEVILNGMRYELGIPHDAALFDHYFAVFSGRAINLDFNSEERRLFAMLSEGKNLAEIVEAAGAMQAIRLLYALHRQGFITMVYRAEAAAPVQTGGRTERTVTDFNSIFMDIFSILQAKVQGEDVLGRLNSFFDDMQPEIADVFHGVRFLADGSLPVEQVLANLHGIERDDKVALVVKAFNELLYFTLFEMKNFLSREDAERLMEIVQNMELF